MQTVPRLIQQFIPSNYQLSLILNRTDRIFSGIVTIIGVAKAADKSIIVHGKDLNIESVVVDGKAADFSYGDNDSLIISHPDINPGEHIIVISFDAKITDAMHGMYPCYYDHEGSKKELLATQFESHHAREVFPCIDEPEAKATFDVTLSTEQNVTVLSNMPIVSQNVDGSQLITRFETTPIMSSYLLAWVVGELHKKTGQTKRGVEVNAWATPAQSSASLDFAVDIAVRSIDFFEEYFGTPYPLKKSDHVALPDFSSGAMENWGLITYREIALLADPESTAIATKRYIATVIAHELSHQWFGNLVTMKWWNDLWLNESFASLVEYTAVDALEPGWDVWLDFATYDSIIALKRDSLAGVQPVQTDVNHPDEINTLFDGAIVYAKGARLLQMLQHYIGDEAFRSGLQNYFRQHAYKSTEAKDLWSALSDTSYKDVDNFMTRWISQPGYPVLHVSRSGNQISMAQEKLTCNGQKSDVLWPIPLNSNCHDLPEIFDDRSIEIEAHCDEPIRFNIGSYAHFITHYSQDMLAEIVKQLEDGELSTIDRLQLLNEQILLASAGIISNANIVSLLDAYKNETAESVWDIIAMAIGDLKKFVNDDKTAELKLQALADSIAASQYERLGWTKKSGEPETDTKLRATIIGLMIYSENEAANNQAIELFKAKSVEKLDPELRCLILSAVVRRNNDEQIINDLLDIYKSSSSSELKQDICVGLTATRDSKIIAKLIDKITDTTLIRTQDTARWIIYLIRNKYSREQTWRWVRDNWKWIEDTFGGDKSYDEYPRYVATSLANHQQLDEYIEFFTPLKSVPALTRVIEIGINEITNRVNLIEHDGNNVRQTLLGL